MTCYHPLIRQEDLSKFTRAKDGHLYHPAKVMAADKWEAEAKRLIETPYTKREMIPCGKCIGCRLDYSKEWANRGYLESLQYEYNWFVTLTYDENNITIPEEVTDRYGITWTDPEDEWGGTLVPEDLTRFMNTLRKKFERKGHTGIRFMAAGEYGGQKSRPHYHLIIYNMPLKSDDFFEPRIINKEFYYRSRTIEECWTKGISNISEVTWNNIAYTARYITKKINGEISEDYYNSKGQVKEFFRVSRMPGIGEQYYRNNWKKIYQNDEIIIKNRAGIISSKPPKYYDRLLEKEHPEVWEDIRRKRKHQAEQAALIKDNTTSLTRMEQLELEERSKDESFQKLIRVMEAQM